MEEISLSIRKFYKHFAYKLNNPYLQIGIELTNRCNLNCEFCYVEKSPTYDLPKSFLYKISKELKTLNFISVGLIGGEPLIRKDFGSIYTFFSKQGFLLYVRTNGTLFTKKIVKLFKNNPPFYLGISIYAGSEKGYEKVAGDKHAFKNLLKGLEALYREGIKFHLYFLLSECILEEKEKMLDIAEEFEAPYLVGMAKKELSWRENMCKLEVATCGETSQNRYSQECSLCNGLLWINWKGELQICPLKRESSFDLRWMKLSDVITHLIKEKHLMECQFFKREG
jgi:MoaA/NifB/PqqE/SkfB family radical SAM enzyme